jgi:hypothetical protein
MLAQMKAIRLRAVRRRPETLDPTLFQQVVAEDFPLIRPMLDACRRNDREALNAFDDLPPSGSTLLGCSGLNRGETFLTSRSSGAEAQEQVKADNDTLGPIRGLSLCWGLHRMLLK